MTPSGPASEMHRIGRCTKVPTDIDSGHTATHNYVTGRMASTDGNVVSRPRSKSQVFRFAVQRDPHHLARSTKVHTPKPDKDLPRSWLDEALAEYEEERGEEECHELETTTP